MRRLLEKANEARNVRMQAATSPRNIAWGSVTDIIGLKRKPESSAMIEMHLMVFVIIEIPTFDR